MGANNTVYDKPPSFNDGVDEFADYSDFKGATTDKTEVQKIRFSKKGYGSESVIPATTIPEVWEECCKNGGNKVALRWEDTTETALRSDGSVPEGIPRDKWNALTWQQYDDMCRNAAMGYLELGLNPLDGVTIYGFNSYQWFVSEIAAIFAGGIAAGIYPTDTPEQFDFKMSHSGSSILMMQSFAKFESCLDQCKGNSNLKAVVIWEAGESQVAKYAKLGFRVLTWNGLLKLGKDSGKEDELESRMAAQKPGSVCAYIYTSGTTGNPKAVMITHDNILFESTSALLHLKEHQGVAKVADEERILSYLPLSHVAGMMVDIVMPAVATAMGPSHIIAHFARPYDIKKSTIAVRLQSVQPTVFLGVPRVWEKVAAKVKAVGASIKGAKKKISAYGKSVGLATQNNRQMGGSGEVPWFWDRAVAGFVGSSVAKKLGLDQCKFGFTGAAPISKDTLEYFGSLGLNVNEVYGMSECTGAVTFSCDAAHVWGSCGYALPSQEMKILREDGSTAPFAKDLFNPTEEEQGEICYRGRNIMAGYMANPALGTDHVNTIKKKVTDAIDSDGWLHSGDKGCMDERKMLRITGRYKELIIGAGGENVAPVPIEDEIKRLLPGVKNVLMVGDKRPYNVAFVTLVAEGANDEKPGTDQLEGPGLELNPGTTTISAAMDDKVITDKIWKAINDTNNNGDVVISNAAKIRKYTILPQDFSVETGEITPTFKTKRGVVHSKYEKMVDKIYNADRKATYVKYENFL